MNFEKSSCCLYKFLASLQDAIKIGILTFNYREFSSSDHVLLVPKIRYCCDILLPSARYKSVIKQRSRCNCFMTDFHRLFIGKMNKMIHKKKGASFLAVYIIYVSLVVCVYR